MNPKGADAAHTNGALLSPAEIAARNKALMARFDRESANSHLTVRQVKARYAYTRLLARCFAGYDPTDPSSVPRWVLRGSLSTIARVREDGRFTDDVDLQITIDPDSDRPVEELLKDDLNRDLDDGFTFEVTPMEPLVEDGVVSGTTVQVQPYFYGQKVTKKPFWVDLQTRADASEVVAVPAIGRTDEASAGEPRFYAAVPLEKLIASKLYASSMPDSRTGLPTNTYRYLWDLAYLSDRVSVDGAKLRAAIENEWARRGGDIPAEYGVMDPDLWREKFSRLAQDVPPDSLTDFDDCVGAVKRFADRAFADPGVQGYWNPRTGSYDQVEAGQVVQNRPEHIVSVDPNIWIEADLPTRAQQRVGAGL